LALENNILKPNTKVKIEWRGYYHEITKTKENDIKETFSRKYNISKNLIEIEKVYLKKSESKERVSTAILDSLLNKDKLQQAYKDFFKEKYPNESFDEFLKIDEEVSSQLEGLDKNHEFIERKYKFLWIKAKNIFSFSDFFRDYTKNTGVTTIYSYPGNQGGKTSLSRMPSFLLFGNKIKYGRKTSITFPDVFNHYTEDNEAYIQGEIQIQNEVFFLKRTLIKSKKGAISHTFHLYKYDEDGEYVDFLGRKAVNLSIQQAQVTRKKFEEVIGSYEDYIFSSYYESQNIEKWLETTETERYRLFCEYLGLGILEQKNQVASKMLLNHSKTSLTSKFSLEELKNQISADESEIFNIDIQISDSQKKISKSQKNVTSLQNKILKHTSKLKPLDNKIASLTKEDIESDIHNKKVSYENVKVEIKGIQIEIDNLNKELSNITETKDEINEKFNSAMNSLSDIDNQVPKELNKKLNDIKYKQLEVKETSEMIEVKNNASDEYQNLQVEYRSVNSEIQNLTEEISELPENTVCSKCGHEESAEQKKIAIEAKIVLKKERLQEIKNLGTQAKIELDRIISEHKNILSKERDKISEEIQSVEQEISSYKLNIRNNINKEILEYKRLNSLYNDLERSESKLDLKNETLKLSKVKYENSLETLKLYNESLNDIENNAKISLEIRSVQEEVDEVNKEIKDFSYEINQKNIAIGVLTSSISTNKNMIIDMETDYFKERNLKTYLQVHGDEGLSQHIILTILPQINADLAEVLNGIADFNLLVDFDKKGIRFFYERDGVRFNLYQGSGFEKTVSCLALHYVNMRMTNLPISNNLILDEVFGGVHRDNIEAIRKLLKKLCDVFDNIDVITHTLTDEVRGIADHSIKISKENNFSKIV
jgi:hypothetical protein